MAGTSSVWPLHVALAAITLADKPLAALLKGDKVYSMIAPRDTIFDYLVLGDSNAQEKPTFQRAGEQGAIAIHGWCGAADQMKLLQLYGELHRVVNNARLTLTGVAAVHCLGKLSLVTTTPDPSGEYVHGVFRYEFTTL